jgi:hypothetical protein
MRAAGSDRVSPCLRGEDKGEASERTCLGSTRTLPLSLHKGEATQNAHVRAKIPART